MFACVRCRKAKWRSTRRSLLDCTVRNSSQRGARIEFSTPFAPPAIFELEVPRKNLRGTRHEVARTRSDRRGSYGLASMLKRNGDAKLADFLVGLTIECPHRKHGSVLTPCEAFYPAQAKAKRG